jgi:hypothetical protein
LRSMSLPRLNFAELIAQKGIFVEVNLRSNWND